MKSTSTPSQKVKDRLGTQENHVKKASTLDIERKGRGRLPRTARAKIRILNQHNLPLKIIGEMIGCTALTVSNILAGKGKNVRHDSPHDYDHVDAAFAADFPPIQGQTGSRVNPRDDMKERGNHAPRLDETTISPTRKTQKNVTHTKRTRHTETPSPQENDRSNSSLDSPSEAIDFTFDDQYLDNELQLGTVTEFLSGLPHDISWAVRDFEKIDLGTMEKLLAIADWPEDELLLMFREALPSLPVPKRFILVKGLKRKYQEVISGETMLK